MNREPSSSELPNLDLLRAVAVLLVLSDHVLGTISNLVGGAFHPYDWYFGRLGVLLFFVHTCYVLMASMERQSTTGWSMTRTFYLRRAFRIYPLALLCIGMVLVLEIPPLPWMTYEVPDARAITSNVLLTTNVTRVPAILAPLWSLPIEVQMYLVLPFIFMFTDRASNLTKIGAVYLVALLLALTLPDVSARLRAAQYGPCFMAGIVAFALRTRLQARLPAGFWPVFLAGLVLVYVGIEEITPGFHHTLLKAGICMALAVGIPLFRQSTFAALNTAAHHVAKYSYGVYLFHCIAIWAAFYGFELPWPALQLPFAIALLVVLSVAGYHLLEAPAIRLGVRLSKPRAPANKGTDLFIAPAAGGSAGTAGSDR